MSPEYIFIHPPLKRLKIPGRNPNHHLSIFDSDPIPANELAFERYSGKTRVLEENAIPESFLQRARFFAKEWIEYNYYIVLK